jgi:hypothetical protein
MMAATAFNESGMFPSVNNIYNMAVGYCGRGKCANYPDVEPTPHFRFMQLAMPPGTRFIAESALGVCEVARCRAGGGGCGGMRVRVSLCLCLCMHPWCVLCVCVTLCVFVFRSVCVCGCVRAYGGGWCRVVSCVLHVLCTCDCVCRWCPRAVVADDPAVGYYWYGREVTPWKAVCSRRGGGVVGPNYLWSSAPVFESMYRSRVLRDADKEDIPYNPSFIYVAVVDRKEGSRSFGNLVCVCVNACVGVCVCERVCGCVCV